MTGWLAAYRALERDVREAMRELCGASCARCRRPCCKEVFCREGRDSPFLALVRQGARVPAYDPRRGWLGPSGCRLPLGRPPVCYAYVCPEILAALPGPDHRYAANVLGGLVDRAGELADGRRHAVELDEAGLSALDPAALLARLGRCRAELEACRRALGGAAQARTPFPGGGSGA